MKTAEELYEHTRNYERYNAAREKSRIDAIASKHMHALLERVQRKMLMECEACNFQCEFEVPSEDNQRDLLPRIKELLTTLGFNTYLSDRRGVLFISWKKRIAA